MPKVAVPRSPDIRNALQQALGVEIRTQRGEPIPAAQLGLAGVYVGPRGAIRGFLLTDISCGASLAAARTDMNHLAAEDCVVHGKLNDVVAAGLHEVLDALSILFAPDQTVSLSEVVTQRPMPESVLAAQSRARGRADLWIGVEGYPPGRLTLIYT